MELYVWNSDLRKIESSSTDSAQMQTDTLEYTMTAT